jgi:hypothetical protein
MILRLDKLSGKVEKEQKIFWLRKFFGIHIYKGGVFNEKSDEDVCLCVLSSGSHGGFNPCQQQ